MPNPEDTNRISSSSLESIDRVRETNSVATNAENILRNRAATTESETIHMNTRGLQEELEADEAQGEDEYSDPGWWFSSTAFPLFCGAFGPLANLMSFCGLMQTWFLEIPPGGSVPSSQSVDEPVSYTALKSISFALAVIANLILLLNFARRIRYAIAQPMTITLWYTSSILLIVTLSLAEKCIPSPPGLGTKVLSQAFYYSIIAAVLYFILSSLLLFSMLGAYVFDAYEPSFSSLTMPQRTLMLQTISFVLYLAIGAVVFSKIEDWAFVDAIYWADYTLLMVGLGSDFTLKYNLSRALLIPYALMGILTVGLVVASIRRLVLDRGKVKVVRRSIEKEREKWIEKLDAPSDEWRKREYEVMRQIEQKGERMRKYWQLGIALSAFFVLWLVGALVFMLAEREKQGWTYFESVYFAYTVLTVIGYGDYYPQANSSKPFFVIWSLIAVPTVTIVISNMSDTVVDSVKAMVIWLGQKTILPERGEDGNLYFNLKTEKNERRLRRRKKSQARRRSGEDVEKQRQDESRDGDEGTERGTAKNMEKLGDAVVAQEESHGEGGSVAARITREIRSLAKDIGRVPERKYTWEEWERWIALLQEDLRRDSSGQSGGGDIQQTEEEERRAEWTWLADNGPLFSSGTETEWIIGRLCERLDRISRGDV